MKRELSLFATPADTPELLTAETLQPVSGKRVFIENYGCQMNVSDSEIIRTLLKGAGYEFASNVEEADVVLMNTCAVREHAEERVFGRLGELRRHKTTNPELVIGVLGCMAQHLGEKIVQRAPYVDVVMGPDAYRQLPHALAAATDEPFLDLRLDKTELYDDVLPMRQEGVKAWLTIQRGCDKFCTFCIVPFVRGRERSIPLAQLVDQTRELADDGVREITLLGQTVNSYFDGTHDFADLLEAIAEVNGIERVRFTSPHPSDATDAMIRVMARNPKVCKHIHLPLQSGSNETLKRMRRTYAVEDYLKIVDDLRTNIPTIGITTDVIVGFPGETDEDFRATYDVMAQVRYDGAFMFKYSPRDGTVAYKKFPDDVSDEEKVRRLQEIIALQETVSREIYAARVGETVTVMIEGTAKRDENQHYGKTDDFKTCVFPRESDSLGMGDLVRVRIDQATAHTLIGRRVGNGENGR